MLCLHQSQERCAPLARSSVHTYLIIEIILALNAHQVSFVHHDRLRSPNDLDKRLTDVLPAVLMTAKPYANANSQSILFQSFLSEDGNCSFLDRTQLALPSIDGDWQKRRRRRRASKYLSVMFLGVGMLRKRLDALEFETEREREIREDTRLEIICRIHLSPFAVPMHQLWTAVILIMWHVCITSFILVKKVLYRKRTRARAREREREHEKEKTTRLRNQHIISTPSSISVRADAWKEWLNCVRAHKSFLFLFGAEISFLFCARAVLVGKCRLHRITTHSISL